MVTLVVGAHELDLLFFLPHPLDLMAHLVDHYHFLRSRLSFTENMLSWKFDSSLWEASEVWRDLLKVDVLLSHVALNQEIVLDILDYLDLLKKTLFLRFWAPEMSLPLMFDYFLRARSRVVVEYQLVNLINTFSPLIFYVPPVIQLVTEVKTVLQYDN